MLYIDGVRPTRKDVVKTSALSLITGGVNYFAAYPVNKNLKILDELLLPHKTDGFETVGVDFIKMILSELSSELEDDWNSRNFINAVNMLESSQELKFAKLLVRIGRNLSKNTGTMLSASDRDLTDKYQGEILLVMYRVNGEISKGWSGKPFWMPNIKLPEGFTFYKMN